MENIRSPLAESQGELREERSERRWIGHESPFATKERRPTDETRDTVRIRPRIVEHGRPPCPRG